MHRESCAPGRGSVLAAMNATPHCQALRRLWWLQPDWLFAAVTGITVLAAALQSDGTYRLYGAPKFLAGLHVLLAAVAIAVFALGRRLAAATGCIPATTPIDADRAVRF